MKIKPKPILLGTVETLTIIDNDNGVGLSATFDEQRILHWERLKPSDWGD